MLRSSYLPKYPMTVKQSRLASIRVSSEAFWVVSVGFREMKKNFCKHRALDLGLGILVEIGDARRWVRR
jgi:hypothetical protein